MSNPYTGLWDPAFHDSTLVVDGTDPELPPPPCFVAAVNTLGLRGTIGVDDSGHAVLIRLPYVGRLRETIISVAKAYKEYYSGLPDRARSLRFRQVIEGGQRIVREEKAKL